MTNESKKIAAQKREMPEPYEGNHRIPWFVLLIVGSLFLWAIGYLYTTYDAVPPAYGDNRIAADFKVASASEDGKIDGAQLYTSQCLACHQASGNGLSGVFPPLADSEWVTGRPEVAIQIVLHGASGELTVAGTTYNGMMPSFKDKLGDAEIAALISHIRTNFGNNAGAIDAALVTQARQATAEREQPWNGDADLNSMR